MPIDKSLLEWICEGGPLLEDMVHREIFLERRGSEGCDLLQPLVGEVVSEWPELSNHKKAGHPIHKLTFLSDLELQGAYPELRNLGTSMLKNFGDGLPRVPMNVPTRYGGSGRSEMSWALCDAPLIIYSLASLLPERRDGVMRMLDGVVGMVRDNGWPCKVSNNLGSFRGPGKKSDPCPLSTLYVLKAIGRMDCRDYEREARIGTETVLSLWKNSRNEHPYQFHMGTDFRKLKFPFVWYDILHVSEVLSHFPWVLDDPRFKEMIGMIASRSDAEGRYAPESVWMDWKGWEFSRRKEPSRWLTLKVVALMNRVERI